MQPTARPQPSEPVDEGPFRADQIRDGDPYELSNGHPILCMGASDRHSSSNAEGTKVLATDPAVTRAGVDTAVSFNEGKNLRAPDISLGNLHGQPGWAKELPLLAVEYADTGQVEKELQKKIKELLRAGTKYVWVVRLMGPLRVKVYEPRKKMRLIDGDGVLTAPGILQNPVPVRALVDPDAANAATLRNLLNREGYASLDDVKAKSEAQGQAQGQAQALLTVLQARGLAVSDAGRAHILACTDGPTLTQWLMRAATAATAADVIGD